MNSSEDRSFVSLLDALIPLGGGFILRNSFSTAELKGEIYTFKVGGDWVTIFPKRASSSEEFPHIHLKWKEVTFGVIRDYEKRTSQLTFWEKLEDFNEDLKPPFAFVFPSFFDWKNEAAPILKNRELFNNWIEKYGRTWNFI